MTETKNDEITNVKLFMYMSWENAQKFIETGMLKATEPLKTNDPFEFTPKAVEGKSHEEVRQRKDDDFALFCFSRSITSAAMWGHYGDKHKGVCLVFDFPIIKNNKFRSPYMKMGNGGDIFLFGKVSYQKERVDTKNNAKLVLTKDESWAFEQECRFMGSFDFATEAKDGIFLYNQFFPYFRGIVLGAKFELSVHYVKKSCLETINKIRMKNMIKVVRGKFHDEEFKIINEKWEDTKESDIPEMSEILVKSKKKTLRELLQELDEKREKKQS